GPRRPPRRRLRLRRRRRRPAGRPRARHARGRHGRGGRERRGRDRRRPAGVAAAFAYPGDPGVPVVNASLGSSSPSQAERRAIREHPNTLYVVAAGNGGPDGIGDDNDDDTREYPCAHDEPNLVCVGATDANDARAGFSNYGMVSVDLLAPGLDVVSDWVRGKTTVLNQYFGVG